MADVTVTSAEQAPDGTVTIKGSNFTQTTTIVEVDGNETEFTFVSSSELTVDNAPPEASEISVTKNGVTESVEINDTSKEGEGGEGTEGEGGQAASGADTTGESHTESQDRRDEGISPDAPRDPRQFIAAQDSDTTRQPVEEIQSGPTSPQVNQDLEPAVPSVSYLDVDPNQATDFNLEGEGDPRIVIPPLAPSGLEAAPKAIAPGTWPSPIDGFRGAVPASSSPV